MDAETRELVAVAASMAGGCEDCLKQHVAEARRVGVRAEELREAVNIGRALALRVKLHFDALAETLLQEEELVVVSSGCGCGPDCGCEKGA